MLGKYRYKLVDDTMCEVINSFETEKEAVFQAKRFSKLYHDRLVSVSDQERPFNIRFFENGKEYI